MPRLQRALAGTVTLPLPKGSESHSTGERQFTKDEFEEWARTHYWKGASYGWIDVARFGNFEGTQRFQRGSRVASHQIARAIHDHFPEQFREPKAYRVHESKTHAVCRETSRGHYRQLAKVNIVRIARQWDTGRPALNYYDMGRHRVRSAVFLTAEEIASSFDMRQCAISVTVDARLKAKLTCSAETLDAARRGRIVFSPHCGSRSNRHIIAERLERYLARGFTIGEPPQPPEELPFATLGYDPPERATETLPLRYWLQADG